MAPKDQFRFKRLDHIGVADARNDEKFLSNCFVDTGALKVLLDCADSRQLVLGRTGSGKTALLSRVSETAQNVIVVQPESLALAYISNSTILNFVSQLGVKLDIFYRLLWRHVFTVEIIKARFELDSEQASNNFVERLVNGFRNKKHKQALQYLEKWGKSFWEETDYRIKEVTTKLESDLKASIGTNFPHMSFGAEGVRKLSEEQKKEVAQRAQSVVNQVQIRELSEIIDLLDEVLDDPKKRYYILIDRLDENWIEDKLRYLLIRALIETAKDFHKVRHAKIIIALRWDLIDRVFRLTRDTGFQEEKYQSMYLEINWTKEQLIDVIDKRISHLVRQRYSPRQSATHRDLLPKTNKKVSAVDFIVDRTMMRPRDVILFFNACISQAIDSPRINAQMLKQAEGEYSRARLRSLADEWHADYPNLIRFTEILKNRRSSFTLGRVTNMECEEFCLNFLIEGSEHQDDLSKSALELYDGKIRSADFLKTIVQIFYKVGLVGLKLESYESVCWSISGRRSVSSAEIQPDIHVAIHPCVWRTLGVRE